MAVFKPFGIRRVRRASCRSCDGEARLPRLLHEIGIREISLRTISIERVIEELSIGTAEEILGSPLADFVKPGREESRDVIALVLLDCRDFVRGDALATAQHSLLATAAT